MENIDTELQSIDEMVNTELYAPIPEQETAPERFAITSDSAANWALRKIAQAKRRDFAFRVQAKERIDVLTRLIDNIEVRVQDSAADCERTIGYFTGLLARYTQTLPPERVKSAKTRASVTFADGRVIRKFATSKLVVRDKDKLAAALSAAKRDDLIRVKTEPAWDKIKPGVSVEQANDETVYTYTDAETGEIINLPGMGTETTPESYEIEV